MQEARCKRQGARCTVQGARCKEHRARCKQHCARCTVKGALCKEQGASGKVHVSRNLKHKFWFNFFVFWKKQFQKRPCFFFLKKSNLFGFQKQGRCYVFIHGIEKEGMISVPKKTEPFWNSFFTFWIQYSFKNVQKPKRKVMSPICPRQLHVIYEGTKKWRH